MPQIQITFCTFIHHYRLYVQSSHIASAPSFINYDGESVLWHYKRINSSIGNVFSQYKKLYLSGDKFADKVSYPCFYFFRS